MVQELPEFEQKSPSFTDSGQENFEVQEELLKAVLLKWSKFDQYNFTNNLSVNLSMLSEQG